MQHLLLSRFSKNFGRALALLSLLMLMLVGGTFSHATELPHQHFDQHSGKEVHGVAHHDHISDANQDDTQLNGLHCGADIHCLISDPTITFTRIFPDGFQKYGRRYSKAIFWPDPPPPRMIS